MCKFNFVGQMKTERQLKCKIFAGCMAMLVTLFCGNVHSLFLGANENSEGTIVQNIFRSHGAAGHPVPCPGQHLQLRHSQCPQGWGSDGRGDVGSVLYHSRLWSSRRIRSYSQNYSNWEEKRCQGEIYTFSANIICKATCQFWFDNYI